MTSVGQSRRATDSGFVGLLIWSSKWCRWELDKIHRGLSAFGKRMNEILQCTDPTWRGSQKRLQLVSWKGKSPQIQQCFHHRATDVLVWYVREKQPSTSAFFFLLQDNCWDLILMLFFLCSFVFSCKNLTVLECLYFIKCVLIFFFWLLYPRIAVIILMSQYLTSFCERDQRQERKTLNTFSSNVDSFTLAIQKN